MLEGCKWQYKMCFGVGIDDVCMADRVCTLYDIIDATPVPEFEVPAPEFKATRGTPMTEQARAARARSRLQVMARHMYESQRVTDQETIKELRAEVAAAKRD